MTDPTATITNWCPTCRFYGEQGTEFNRYGVCTRLKADYDVPDNDPAYIHTVDAHAVVWIPNAHKFGCLLWEAG